MTREEKIQLNDLIGKYIREEIEPELKKREYPTPETKFEYLALLTMQRHKVVLQEVQETIIYDF